VGTRRELLDLLRGRGVRPRRSLGQHFLVDDRYLDRIVELGQLGPGDAVLEVGAGTGLLTRRLAASAGAVVAVELDGRLADVLEEALVARHVRVVRGDAMALDLAALFPPGLRRKVVANLPYGIASPLLVRLLQDVPGLERLVVTVQQEVARRIVARPGSRDYGLLTLLVHLHADARLALRIPPGAFLPPPRVHSAVVVLTPHDRPGARDPGLLDRLLHAAFGQRRKQLRNAWGALAPRAALERAARHSGLDLTRRGEELTLEEFCAFADALARELADRSGHSDFA
jgi:16S rRNA (adenine1518-N6/adenine1519-N6)-dimethyltransferase